MTKASTKQARRAASAIAEAQPHIVRSSPYYQRMQQRLAQRRLKRAEHVTFAATHNMWKAGVTDNERPGKRNPMVAMLRQRPVVSAAKQTGRRYGPEPLVPGRQRPYPPKATRLLERLADRHGGYSIIDETTGAWE